jgi:hypothetical protein
MPVSDSAAWAIVLAAILLIVLYFRAKAGLMIAIKAILDKQETSFGRAFRFAGLFFNRILIISILAELGLALLAVVLGGPVAVLFKQHFLNRAVVLLVLALLIFIPAAVTAILVNILAPMFVVIFDLKIQEAVSSAFELIKKYRFQLILFGLLLFSLELAPLFLMSIVVKLHRGLTTSLFCAAAFLIIESAVAVFAQTAWVLAFLELVKPQKVEEERVPLPEVI